MGCDAGVEKLIARGLTLGKGSIYNSRHTKVDLKDPPLLNACRQIRSAATGIFFNGNNVCVHMRDCKPTLLIHFRACGFVETHIACAPNSAPRSTAPLRGPTS